MEDSPRYTLSAGSSGTVATAADPIPPKASSGGVPSLHVKARVTPSVAMKVNRPAANRTPSARRPSIAEIPVINSPLFIGNGRGPTPPPGDRKHRGTRGRAEGDHEQPRKRSVQLRGHSKRSGQHVAGWRLDEGCHAISAAAGP